MERARKTVDFEQKYNDLIERARKMVEKLEGEDTIIDRDMADNYAWFIKEVFKDEQNDEK